MLFLYHLLELFVVSSVLHNPEKVLCSGAAFSPESAAGSHLRSAGQWQRSTSTAEATEYVDDSYQSWMDEFKCDRIARDVEKKEESLSVGDVSATDSTLPSPTDLRLEHISSAAVHLFWDYAPPTDTPSPVQFLVQCSRDRHGYANASNLLNATDYVFDLLCLAAEYEFQVLAYSGGVFSKPSASSEWFLNGVTAPAGPPTDIEAIVLSPRSIELTWEPPFPSPPGTTVYILYWGYDPDNLTKKDVLADTTHYSFNNLLPAHTYYFSLVADVSSHLSIFSAVVNATTPADLPPVKIINSTLSTSWVDITWSDPAPTRYPTSIDNFTVFYIEESQLRYPAEIDNMTLYSSIVVAGDNCEANISHLVPGTEYLFRLLYSSDGIYLSTLSEAEKLRTLDCLICTMCTAVNSTCLKIVWETSLTRHHVLQTVTILEKSLGRQASLQSSATSGSYLIGGLHPWTEHVVTVAIGNDSSPTHLISQCPVTECVTKEDVPSQPPLHFRVTSTTSKTLSLAWEPPPPDAQNGVITHYFLHYTCTHPPSWAGCGSRESWVVQSEDVTVVDLIPYTEYRLQVAAETQVGRGPYTLLVKRTDPDVPTQAPTNVSLLRRTETSFHLVWDPPDPWNRNGPIIGYTIAYHVDTDGGEGAVIGEDIILNLPKNEKHNVSGTEIEITGLRPQTSYVVSVSARTEVGEGPYSAPLIITTSQSDVFATASTNLNVQRLTGDRDGSCFVLAISWDAPFTLFANLSQFEHDITGTVINYTLVFTSREGCVYWSSQLDTTDTTYNVTGQQLTSGDTYSLHLRIDALLGNGSYLHLVSPALNLTTPTCTSGEGSSSDLWKVATGASLGGSGLLGMLVFFFLCVGLKLCHRRRHVSTAVVLMDSYRGGMNLEESENMSLTLRVGDGATMEDSETEDSRTPSPSGESQAKMEDTDEMSLSSSAGEETPLLLQGGSCAEGTRDSVCLFSRSSTPVSLPERPMQLIPPSIQRLSPEGCSFSSSSSSSSSSPAHTTPLPSPQTPD